MSKEKQSSNNEKEKYFKWSRENNVSKLFPIDPTRKDFVQSIGPEYSVGAIQDHLLTHPFFIDLLSGMCFSKEQNKKLDKPKSDYIPIPLEAVPFLTEFFLLAQDSSYKDVYNGEKTISKQQIEIFTRKFCNNLCKKITLSDSGSIANILLRHILMKNSDFKSAILDDIWEDDLFSRIQKLQNLAKYAPFEVQEDILQGLLRHIDQAIFTLTTYKHAEPSGPLNTEKPLQRMLEDILSIRHQSESSRNEYATYLVDSIIIDKNTNMSMEQAFRALNRTNPDRQLLASAQKAYLSCLAAKNPASAFEEKYLALQNYLASSNFKIDDAKLEKLIVERCKLNCQGIISFALLCSRPEPITCPPTSVRKYITDLIDTSINLHMNGALDCFRETIQILTYYTSLQIYCVNDPILLLLSQTCSGDSDVRKYSLQRKDALMALLPNSIAESIGDYCHTEVTKFSQYFRDSWYYLYPNQKDVVDAHTCYLNKIEYVAAILSRDGQLAAKFFGREELFPYTEEDLIRMCTAYNQIITGKTTSLLITDILNFAPQILTGIFLEILQHIVETSIPKLMHSARFYIATSKD